MTLLDIAALAVVALAGLGGFRRGLVVGAFSLVGLVAGAYLGAKVAPHILRREASVYPPLVALAGVIVGSALGQWVAVTAGRSLREMFRIGVLRALDNVGGALLGAATGFVLVWFLGSILLYTPGDTRLRRAVQRSSIVSALTGRFPPSRVIDALARVDPFGTLVGPALEVGPGDPALVRDPDVRLASRSVLRVIGNACGLGIEGSGWVVAPGYVVTNAHVVAGVDTPVVDRHGGPSWRAAVVAFDRNEDLAVLRVPGLKLAPLRLAAPEKNVPVIVYGYPDDGPLRGVAGRLGDTRPTFVRDPYGPLPVARTVTSLRALIRPGNSGGPVVDAAGRVRAVVFARRAGTGGGLAIPSSRVSALLRQARGGGALHTPCAES